MNSPVKLGISPAASTPTGFCHQKFWSFHFPHWNPGLHTLSHSLVVTSSLSALEYGTTWFASCHLARLVCHLASSPLCPGCPTLPLLLVWMNVSFLTPWLSDFHTVRFSDRSGCFLFLNLLLSFFWLCEEAKCVYLCLHLGQKSGPPFFS